MTSPTLIKLSTAIALTGIVAFGAGVVAAERFPELARADHALHDARGFLDHAAHDFGGHRVAAIKHIDEAMAELAEARRFAGSH